jgi:GcrA cell cycle regulator
VSRATFLGRKRKRGDAMADVGREEERERPDNDAEDRQALRAARGARGLTRFTWSEERVALLRRRWAEGLSASAIAKELGADVSRNAVLGKIHRLELKQPGFKRRYWRKDRAVLKRPRVPRPTRSRRGSRQLMTAFYALGLDQFFGAPEPPPIPSLVSGAGKAFGAACGLLDLTDATCRWPVGEPGEADFAFCGAAPFRRYPYCVGHCLIAYRPESSESAQRRTAEPLRRDHGIKHAA